MKKILIAIFGISFLWFSCPQEASPTTNPTPEPFNGQSARITELFSPANYSGPGTALTSTNSSSTSPRLMITSPIKASLNADAYVDITGTIDTTAEDNDSDNDNDIPWFLMRLRKGTSTTEETWYWLKGTQNTYDVPFSQRVWLRFGPGTYSLTIYSMNYIIENSMGVFSSWSYWNPPATTITIVNTNSEDGRFLYPSAIIQSDNISILSVAGTFSATTPYDYIQAIHDYVVCDIFYDNDSLVIENRKPQDALYVITNGLAVC